MWLEEASMTGLSEQEAVELIDIESYFYLTRKAQPGVHDVIEELISAHMLKRDESGITVKRLCSVLLAKRLSDFPDIEFKAPRVIVYNGTSKINPREDYFGKKGYACGFQGLVQYVMERLPQNEVMEKALRTKAKLVPEEPIRELLANALIHQDFSVTGVRPTIEIYEDRVEILNPGEPVIPTERFIDGAQSRNERLAKVMGKLHICEERSSGVDKVIVAAEALQLPAPSFDAGYQSTSVTIFGPKAFEDMDRSDRIRACFQHCVLMWVAKKRMSNQTLRERFKLSDSRSSVISQIISKTVEAGLVKRDSSSDGSRKQARYVPVWAP